MPRHYDAVIIIGAGAGAGGGTFARKLAPSGIRILPLERGGYVPREKKNWDLRFVNVEGGCQTRETWYGRDGKPLHPQTNYCAGGKTKFYATSLFRPRRKERAGHPQRRGGRCARRKMRKCKGLSGGVGSPQNREKDLDSHIRYIPGPSAKILAPSGNKVGGHRHSTAVWQHMRRAILTEASS